MRLLCALLFLGACLTAQDSTPKERQRTVRELAKQGAAAIPQLVPYLKDESVDVRAEAASAIANIGGAQAIDPLLSALADFDPDVRIPAIDGITNFYLPGYIAKGWTAGIRRLGRGIKSRFTDTNTQIIDPSITVREDVIAAFGKIVREDPDLAVRQSAARSLGILRGRAAARDLLEALRNKDKDSTLIYESVIALQKIRDPQTAEGMLFLLTDLNERVQIAAIETVGILRYREAQPKLREAFDRARNARVRRAALGALGMIPDEANRTLFETYLTDRDEGLRAAAAEGIGRLGNAGDLPKIEQLFNEEKKRTAQLSLAFAAVLLGRRDLTQFSPLDFLLSSLNNSSWSGVAAPFLEEICRIPAVRQSLYPTLAQRTRAEKVELARILSLAGDQDTVPVLESLTRDPDTEVGLAASRAIRVLKARL
jgi:HEAT repeat protein